MATLSLSTALSTLVSRKFLVPRAAAGITDGRYFRPSGGEQLGPALGPLEGTYNEPDVPGGGLDFLEPAPSTDD